MGAPPARWSSFRAGLLPAALAAALAGCAALTLPDRPGWHLPRCYPGVRAVTSAWDVRLRYIFANLYAGPEIDPDVGPVRVSVADGPARLPLAFTCGDARGHAIYVTARGLAALEPLPDSEVGLAHLLAHELAHVALARHPRTAPATRTEREHGADGLAMYYLERAGYDCEGAVAWRRRLAGAIVDPAGLAQACRLAKRGLRPAAPAAPAR